MLVAMRPSAFLATALGVLLPIACAAPAPAEPTGRPPAALPTVATPPTTPAVAQPIATPPTPPPLAPAIATTPPPVARASEPAGTVDDCGLRATIAADRGRDGTTQYTLTLKNEGATARTLVTPGDGSEDGRRTPVLAWSGTRGGQPAPQLARPGCGLMNAIEASEIFTLEPGASRAMSTWIIGPSYGPGRYEVRLRYTNDPGDTKAAQANPEVAALIARTSACDVTSAPLTIQVP